MSLCVSVYMCFVVTCWERADLLALVCGVFCEFVTFPLVSWVRCGTWLYRFLIFAPLLTFIIPSDFKTISFDNSHYAVTYKRYIGHCIMGECGEETWFCCSVRHSQYAQTRIYQNLVCQVIFFYKASYPTQRCLAKALAWMTQMRTRISICQRIMKTTARLLTGVKRKARQTFAAIFKWGKS